MDYVMQRHANELQRFADRERQLLSHIDRLQDLLVSLFRSKGVPLTPPASVEPEAAASMTSVVRLASSY